VPENAPGIVDDVPAVAPASDGVVEALTAHIDDLRGQLSAQSTAHAAEITRLVDAHARLREDHAREIATLRDVNRDQFVILERLSVPRLPDSQSTAPRPWWRLW
jgi:hypothetical protein